MARASASPSSPCARPSICPQPRRRRGTSATSAVSSCRRRAGETPRGGSASRARARAAWRPRSGGSGQGPSSRRPEEAPAAGRRARGPPRPESGRSAKIFGGLLHGGRREPRPVRGVGEARRPEAGQVAAQEDLDALLGRHARRAEPLVCQGVEVGPPTLPRSRRRSAHKLDPSGEPVPEMRRPLGIALARQVEELVAVQDLAAQGLANLLGRRGQVRAARGASCRSGARPPAAPPSSRWRTPSSPSPRRGGSSSAAAFPARPSAARAPA